METNNFGFWKRQLRRFRLAALPFMVAGTLVGMPVSMMVTENVFATGEDVDPVIPDEYDEPDEPADEFEDESGTLPDDFGDSKDKVADGGKSELPAEPGASEETEAAAPAEAAPEEAAAPAAPEAVASANRTSASRSSSSGSSSRKATGTGKYDNTYKTGDSLLPDSPVMVFGCAMVLCIAASGAFVRIRYSANKEISDLIYECK